MAIPVVEVRLGAISNARKRNSLALHLAETCYECFWVERLFRELINCDPEDDDMILAPSIDLDLAFDHVAWHIRELKRPLAGAIKAVDLKLESMSERRSK